MDKLVSDIVNILKIVETKGEKKNKVYVYVIPGEKDFYDIDELNKRVGKEVKIFSVKDSDKYDPSNISKKAKPGKPGIYLEWLPQNSFYSSNTTWRRFFFCNFEFS